MIINERAPNILLIVTPLAATAVFLLDILGPVSPYSSALYVPFILLSIWVFSAAGVAYTGLVCFVMTIAGFVLSRNEGFERTSPFDLFAILAVIAITTIIALVIARPAQ
jgi:hypothetical protein